MQYYEGWFNLVASMLLYKHALQQRQWKFRICFTMIVQLANFNREAFCMWMNRRTVGLQPTTWKLEMSTVLNEDVLDCGPHWLDVSTCQEYRRRLASAASPSTVPQCGTVCRQHCVTAACHWTRFSGGWRLICLDSHERHPAPLWRFCVILVPDINVMKVCDRQRALVWCTVSRSLYC